MFASVCDIDCCRLCHCTRYCHGDGI